MARSVLKRAHKQVLADHIDATARARSVEEGVAARAVQVEKDLMAEGRRLKGALDTCGTEYKRRRLERDYLRCMHRLGAVRRARALAQHTLQRLPETPKPRKQGKQRVRKGLVAELVDLLRKARVKGHWRTNSSGKMFWVQEHQVKRQRRSVFEDDRPKPTGQQGLFGGGEPAAAPVKPAGQGSLFGGDEPAEKPAAEKPAEPEFSRDYHFQDADRTVYALERTEPGKASIVVRTPEGNETKRLASRPIADAEADLRQIAGHKFLRTVAGKPKFGEPDELEGFRVGERYVFGLGGNHPPQPCTLKRIERVTMAPVGGLSGAKHVVATLVVELPDGTERHAHTSELHEPGWKPPARKPAENRPMIPGLQGGQTPPKTASEPPAPKHSGVCAMNLNKEKNGVELYFEPKPSAEVRDRMKAAGFRWSRRQGCWYARQTEKRLALARTLSGDDG